MKRLILLVPFFLFCKFPVIISTDVDLDDSVAIAYLLSHSDVDVLGIAVCRDGATRPLYGVPNAMRITKLCNQPKIPVAYGAYFPISPFGHFPSYWRDSADNAANTNLPTNFYAPAKLLAPEFIISLIKQSREPVTILSLCPMTNVALALSIDPSIAENIKAIYHTGVSSNKHPAWNIVLDTGAASNVISANIPFIGLTNQAMDGKIPERVFEGLQNIRSDKSLFCLKLSKEMASQNGNLYDFLTAACFTNPEVMTNVKKTKLTVGVNVNRDYGLTHETMWGNEIDVVESLDQNKCFDLLLERLDDNGTIH